MASFNFQTTISSMQTAYNELESAKGELDSALSALESELDSAIPGWVGQASQAYVALQQRWNTDQTTINNALQDLANTLQQASINYQKTEQANTANFPVAG